MFFSITPHKDTRFFNHDRIGQYWFNHDDGWQRTHNGWCKGYDYPEIDHGNYAGVVHIDDRVELHHDRYRSFPLWTSPDVLLTNLKIEGDSIWADDRVWIQDCEVKTQKTDMIGTIDCQRLDQQSVVDMVLGNLQAKFQRLFADHDVPKRLFLSGGIDTTMIAALCRPYRDQVEVINYAHFDYDDFTNRNIGDMVSQHPFDIRANHWAYRNAHHWCDPAMLMTGSCGDEYTMRGPDSIAIWAAWHDIDLHDMLTKSQGYHVQYFLRDKNIATIKRAYQDRQRLQDQCPTYADLMRRILDINANDHQLWHLGHTLHWTPFKDLALLQIFLRLDHDSMISQILDAGVSKRIIATLDPALVGAVSGGKNYIHRTNLHTVIV